MAIAKLMSDYDPDYNIGIEKCQSAIKKLPSHGREPRWVPVKEKLPTREGDYIVTQAWYGDKKPRITVAWWDCQINNWATLSAWEITAWMDVAPYEGEEDESNN